MGTLIATRFLCENNHFVMIEMLNAVIEVLICTKSQAGCGHTDEPGRGWVQGLPGGKTGLRAQAGKLLGEVTCK